MTLTHLMYDPGGWSFEVGLGSPCGLAMPLSFLSPAPGGLKPETVPGLKRPEVGPGALRPLNLTGAGKRDIIIGDTSDTLFS